MLDVVGLSVGYGELPVVRELELHVGAGEFVALLGPNGAGKTTTMLALAGVVPSTGRVTYDGQPLVGPLHKRARLGVGFIPEERAVFRQLSTRVNLELGDGGIEGALELFPELEQLLDRTAGLLSGGEQQMLVLARALAARPRLLLVDELSLGLAPKIVQRLLDSLQAATERGMAVLVVEQHAELVLRHADSGYVMQRGAIRFHGTGSEMRARIGEIERSYLGLDVALPTGHTTDSDAN